MIISTLKQTNSLINVGDSITIKTDNPIIPKKTLILGWYLTTNDIIDKENYISGEYAILPLSDNSVLSENDLNWTYLGKGIEGVELSDFCDKCNSQTEPYYICFRFKKIRSTGQIINIDKVSLRIQDNLEAKDDYDTPHYDDSIFGDEDLYSECHIKWMANVLDKVKTPGILPTFIKRDRDFSIFWGWLCHWYSVIVCFGRKFLNIFSNKDLFREFLRQQDIYADDRSKDIYTTVDIFVNGEELLYTFKNNTKLEIDHTIKAEGWITTDFIDVQGSNIIKFEFYNLSNLDFDDYRNLFLEECDTNIYISFLDYNKQFMGSYTINTKNNGLEYFCKVPTNENMKYLVFSYEKLYTNDNVSIPLYLRIYNYGKSYFGKLQDLNKYDLLSVFNEFRERGTNKTQNIIQQFLNTSIGDSFYSNYIPGNYIGWFLNKTSPVTTNNFKNDISLNKILLRSTVDLNTGTLIKFDDNFLELSDTNSINIKWNRTDITKLFVFISLYTEQKEYKDAYTILNKRNDLHGIVIKNIPIGITEVILPMNIVKSINQIGVLDSIVQIDYKDLYLFVSEAKIDDEIYKFKYLQIKAIYFVKDNLTTFTSDENDELINSDNNLHLDKNIITLNKNIISETLKIYFGSGGETIIGSSNDTILGVYFDNSIFNNATYKIYYELKNFNINIKLTVIMSNQSYVFNFNYTILESDKENGYKEIKLIDIDDSGNETYIGYILFRLKKYSLSSIDGLIVRNPYDKISLFDKEEVIETSQALDVSYNLYNLPYNFGFLNLSNWYLNYYKNNSRYSDAEAENIISQKFLPYNSFKLFQKSDKVLNKVVRPLSYINFEIKNPTVCYVNETDIFYGDIILSWRGGNASYQIKIEGITSNNIKGDINFTQIYSNINKTSYILSNIPTGIYKITLIDSLGNSLIRDNVIISALKPIEVKWKIYLIPGKVSEVNKLDEVYLNVSGGYAPFKITYPTTSGNMTIDTDNNIYIKLDNFNCERNKEINIKIVDYYNNEKDVIYYNNYQVIGDDSNGGNCEIITE